jgi:hypothetical protein
MLNSKLYLWQVDQGPYFLNHYVSIYRLMRRYGFGNHPELHYVIFECRFPQAWQFLERIGPTTQLELRYVECGRPDNPVEGEVVMGIDHIRPTAQWMNKLTILNPEDVRDVIVHLSATCHARHLIQIGRS